MLKDKMRHINSFIFAHLSKSRFAWAASHPADGMERQVTARDRSLWQPGGRGARRVHQAHLWAGYCKVTVC